MAKRKYKTPAELEKDTEQFLKGKELRKDGKELFEKVIKRAVKTSVRSPKSS